jgi:hypothetical protein
MPVYLHRHEHGLLPFHPTLFFGSTHSPKLPLPPTHLHSWPLPLPPPQPICCPPQEEAVEKEVEDLFAEKRRIKELQDDCSGRVNEFKRERKARDDEWYGNRRFSRTIREVCGRVCVSGGGWVGCCQRGWGSKHISNA